MQPSLRRELGQWDLTAIGVNQVIGGAVFAAPATLALSLGSWSWVGFAVAGLLSMAVALNFAEAGSRVEGTGGPYLYARAAFGRFVSFEVGWIAWFTRVASWASVVNILVDALGFYWPGLRTGVPRTSLMCAVVLAIMVLNLRGIKQSAIAVNLLTVGKLTPLAIFILIGLPFVSWGRLGLGPLPGIEQWSASALMLIFAFGGYEVIPVPAGEARDPRRAVPFAMIATIIVVALVMTLAQIVALGTYPDLPWSRTPLADASLLIIGGWAALMMTIGAAISAAGNNVGAALSGSRSLYALAEQHDIPKIFARIHPKYRTPDVAIIFTCACTLALALSGSFASLAPISAVARLVIYAATCASVLAMRRQGAAPFTVPGGPIVPVLALLVCVVILVGASRVQLLAGAYTLIAGAVLYLIARAQMRKQRVAVASMVLLAVLTPAAAAAQQTVIFVRHAERADGGAGSSMSGAPADPSLSAAGEARAAKLATMLADSGITGIYSTQFKRTQETARPLAAKLGIPITTIQSNDLTGLVAHIKANHQKGVVLIVGHSNTIPDAIKAFGGREIKMADDEYTALYLLTPATGALTLIRF